MSEAARKLRIAIRALDKIDVKSYCKGNEEIHRIAHKALIKLGVDTWPLRDKENVKR
jgi:hypothetical protein